MPPFESLGKQLQLKYLFYCWSKEKQGKWSWMRIFSLVTEEQSYSHVKFWWIYLFHLRKRYTDEKQSIALIINYMMISKIVVLVLMKSKMLLMMWCQCTKSLVKGFYQPPSQAPLCLPCLVFLPTTREAEEREPGNEVGILRIIIWRRKLLHCDWLGAVQFIANF